MPEPVIFLNNEVLFSQILIYSLQDKLSEHSTPSLQDSPVIILTLALD